MIDKVTRKKREYEMMLANQVRHNLYEKPKLNNLFLEVTSRCNARCEHCGSRCDGNTQGEEVSAEDLKRTLKEIAEHYDPYYVYLNVTGGEPLMRKDLFDILNYAVSLGFRWGMTTNGMLINENMFKKIEEAKMSSVSVSIDGMKETHEAFRKVPGSFEKILDGLRMMLKSDVIQIVQVTTVVNKKNIDQLEDIYQLLLDLGIKYWRVINCDPIGRAADNDDILLDLDQYKILFDFMLEKQKEGKMTEISFGCSHYVGVELETEVRNHYFYCLTGLTIASILSNGDIFVCPNVPRRPELIQGNIKTDSFVEVWENKYKPFRHENRTACDECLKCPHWDYCGGGSFHTWNFDENKPNICLRPLFDKEYEEELKKLNQKALKAEKPKKKTAVKKTTKNTTKKTTKKSTKKAVK